MFFKLYKKVSTDTEICYYVETESFLDSGDAAMLNWLFNKVDSICELKNAFEVGPRLSWTSAWSSTIQSILLALNITNVKRVEKSIRSINPIDYDKMTQEIYKEPLSWIHLGR